jgi:hypothetical protein
MTHRILRPLPSAVRGLLFVYSFSYSLTVCLSGGLETLPYGGLPSAVCGPRSTLQARKPPCDCPPSIPRYAVCGPRSAFVYSFPIR